MSMIKIKDAYHEHIGFIFHNMQEKELKGNKRIPLSYRTKAFLEGLTQDQALTYDDQLGHELVDNRGNHKAHNLLITTLLGFDRIFPITILLFPRMSTIAHHYMPILIQPPITK